MARKGKKGTRDWRRRVDVREVEEHIQEEAKDQLTGGPAALKADHELFFMDKGADLSEHAKRSRRGLKIDDLLAPNKHVKSYGVQKKRAQAAPGQAERKLIQRRVASLEKGLPATAARPAKGHSRDLWAKDHEDSKPAFEDGFDDPMRKRKKKAPARITPSALPAVRPAHPGHSYHPSEHAHEAIIGIAAAEEVDRIAREKKLDKVLGKAARVLTEKAKSVDFLHSVQKETSIEYGEQAPGLAGALETADLTKLIEDMVQDQVTVSLAGGGAVLKVSAGADGDDGDEDAGDDDEDDGAAGEKKPAKKPTTADGRKTKQEVRKKKKKVEQARLERKKKKQQVREQLFERLPEMTKKLERRLERQKQAADERKARLQAKERVEPKRLGKLPFKAPDVDVMLPEELPSALRLLKPEGSLLKDRVASLMERNIIEPRARTTQRRRYALKVSDVAWRSFLSENPNTQHPEHQRPKGKKGKKGGK